MEIRNNNEIKAEIILLIMAFSWGISYLMIGVCLEEIVVAFLNSLRFIIGFMVFVIFAKKRVLNPIKTPFWRVF